MNGFRTLSIVIALFTFNVQLAQENAEQDNLSLDKGTINSQFEYIYKKSGNYRADGKRYEVVRTLNLDKLKQNVLDTINAANKKAAELKSTIAGHEATISSLNKKLEDTTNSLVAVTEEKDSMSFLGILVSKITYNSILWTIIAALLGLFLFFVYKFRRSNILTQIAKSNLAELETEYEDHRSFDRLR